MPDNITEIKEDDILEILKEFDFFEFNPEDKTIPKSNEIKEPAELTSSLVKTLYSKIHHDFLNNKRNDHMPHLVNILEEHFRIKNITRKTVVGFDIYQYSKYKPVQQILIPFIFNYIYIQTIINCQKKDPYIFQFYTDDTFKNQFINTGDGGFQILDTPIHGISFLINFTKLLRDFNSYRIYPKLRGIIGNIDIRYALTHDHVYFIKYLNSKSNLYGSGIINNARIMSKDKLNRLLIDNQTYDWFMSRIGGIENLQTICLDQIKNILEFKKDQYREDLIDRNNFSFEKVKYPTHGISTSDALKLDNIIAKDENFTVYNFHFKFIGNYETTIYSSNYAISIGNLNPGGIN